MKKKTRDLELTGVRIPREDLKAIGSIVSLSGSDASTVMRGLIRIGLACFHRESENNKAQALLRVARFGSVQPK